MAERVQHKGTHRPSLILLGLFRNSLESLIVLLSQAGRLNVATTGRRRAISSLPRGVQTLPSASQALF